MTNSAEVFQVDLRDRFDCRALQMIRILERDHADLTIREMRTLLEASLSEPDDGVCGQTHPGSRLACKACTSPEAEEKSRPVENIRQAG